MAKDEITKIERDVSIMLNEKTYIVPSYKNLEEYSRALLGHGLTVAADIIDKNVENAEVQLKAINTIASVSRHIADRLDNALKQEDLLEDDLDEEQE